MRSGQGCGRLSCTPMWSFTALENGIVQIVRVLHGRRNFAAIFPDSKR